MKQKKYSQQCEICKKIFEHEKELVTKQMLGYHKRTAHGIVGPSANAEARRVAARERHWLMKGYSGDKLEAMRASYAAKQSAAPTAEEPVRATKKQIGAEPAYLHECPTCGSRFYVQKSTDERFEK